MDTIDQNTAFELSREFSVAPPNLFAAFIDAATLKEIWGVSRIAVDARPNGQARAELTIDGENWDFTILYQEVVPYEKLRWIVHFDRLPGKEPQATLLFRPTAAGSAVTVRMENFETSQDRDANRQAWEGALMTLRAIFGR